MGIFKIVIAYILTSFLYGERNADQNDVNSLTYTHVKYSIYEGKLVKDLHKEVKLLNELELIIQGASEDAIIFNLLDSSDFQEMKSMKQLGFNAQYCDSFYIYIASGKYLLLGLSTYKGLTQFNVAPSVIYAIEKLPAILREIDTSFDPPQISDWELPRNCATDDDAIDASFEVFGVVGSDCVSNYEYNLPLNPPIKCLNEDTTVQIPPLRGQWGKFEDISAADLKAFIVRVGPVNVEIKQGEEIINKLIIYGWEPEYWHGITFSLPEVVHVADLVVEVVNISIPDGPIPVTYSGEFFIREKKYSCERGLDVTPIDCPCLYENDPRSETTCTPKERPFDCYRDIITVDTPVDACECPEDEELLKLDPRYGKSCKPIDEPEQPCVPTEDTTLDECGCLEKDDPRADALCKTEEKDSADSVHAALRVIIATVFLPALILFV